MLSLPTSYNYVLFEKKTINSEIHELQSKFWVCKISLIDTLYIKQSL